MDFCLNKYKEFLEVISKNKVPVYTVRDRLVSNPEPGIILRHDVDRKPLNSLEIAKLEYKYGIRSTYYFRIVKASFNTKVIKEIEQLGHEIGYHYEDLSVAAGDYVKAGIQFKNNLERFREISDIKTISMHGRPLSKHDNKDLWKYFNINEFNIIGEAFLSIDYNDIYYFTDTGRTWSRKGVNLRDRVKGSKIENIRTTDELITFIQNNKSAEIAIVTHPERWARTKFEYLLIYLKDTLINLIKRLLIILRRT